MTRLPRSAATARQARRLRSSAAPEKQRRGWRHLARRAHRAALAAYPGWFVREFGVELERLFDARVDAAAPVHRPGLAVFLTVDAVASGLAERLRQSHRDRAGHPRFSRSGSRMFDSLMTDTRLAIRHLRQKPTFAAVAILSLALGIGANAALFNVVYAVLVRPLPYQEPDRLVMVWSHNTRQHEPANPVSPANFEAFRAAPSLARIEAMYSFLVTHPIRTGDEPDLALAANVTPGMFSLLGRQAMIGRTFQERDSTDVVVLSHAYWERRFGSDPAVLGRSFLIGDATVPATVLGVMPPDFVFPYRSMLGPSGFTRVMQPDVWKPLTRQTDARMIDTATGQPNRTIHYLAVVGRLAPGATIDGANRDLKAIARARAVEFPDTNAGWDVTVRSIHQQAVGTLRAPLLTLLVGVGVVLMITCINVANVLLARASGRRAELAVRSALGASRWRLIRQMGVESLVLATAGGILGLAIMYVGSRAVLAAAPDLPRLSEAEPGVVILVFVAAVSMLVGLAIGAMPAVAAARSDANESLRESRRTTASRARQRLRAVLIVTEVAMAMVLTLGAGLLLRSFVAVLNVEPGFTPDRLLTFQMGVPARVRSQPERLVFYDDLESRLRALPGVTHVGGTTRLPLGSTNVSTMLDVEGRMVPQAERPEVELRRALFDFFSTMQIPVRRGRVFTRDDGPTSPLVVVINEALAARVFPHEDPLGRRVRFGPNPDAPWFTIIGVVGNVKHGNLEETPRPELYLTYRQGAVNAPFVALRTAGDDVSLGAAVRGVLRDVGADPPASVQTMIEVRSASVAERRFVLVLTGIFGLLALGLAAVGVYGVIALIAAERSSEVGIRLALGATPRNVLRLMLGQAVALAGAGVVIGAGIALSLTPALASQLFGIGGTDPLTYVTVAAVLIGTALVAALAPALRAMDTDPANALRSS